MNENGFVKLYRKLIDWKYAQFPNAVALWVHILIRTNWKDGYFLGTPIPRGSFATSLQRLADETGMHVNTVRKWLKRFEEDGQIERISTNRCTIIKVSNYRAFQDIPGEGYVEPSVEQNVEQNVEQSVHQSVDHSVHNIRSKEIKNDKKERIESKTHTPPTIFEVREFFFNEGYDSDPEDFYQYNEARKWKDKAGNIVNWKVKASDWERHEKKFSSSQSDMKVPVPDWWLEE